MKSNPLRLRNVAPYQQKFHQLLNLIPWLVPVIFVAFVCLLIPFGQVFEYNFDEGFELSRAVLQNEGFTLYQEIWSDQPPLFSQVLRAWILTFGKSIFAARFLILLIAAILVFFFYKILELYLDRWAAIWGVSLLILSRDFLPFSVQVKVDMPALMLLVCSTYFFLRSLHRSQNTLHSAAISGCVIALALQTKLYTVIVLPAFAAYSLLILVKDWRQPGHWRSMLLKSGMFGISSLGMTALILGWYAEFPLNQLLGSHLNAQDFFDNLSFKNLVVKASTRDFSFWALTLVGFGLLFSREGWRIYFPCIWLLTTVISLVNHTPIWPHYYLLLAMPMAWISSFVFFQVKQHLQSSQKDRPKLWQGWNEHRSIALKLEVTILALVLGIHILGHLQVLVRGRHPIQSSAHGAANLERIAVLNKISVYKDQTEWLLTDRQMFGFYADLKVIPELAVLSRKRLVTEGIGGQYILEMIRKYQPEQVVLGRFEDVLLADPGLVSHLTEHYVELDYEDKLPRIRHYLINKLASNL